MQVQKLSEGSIRAILVASESILGSLRAGFWCLRGASSLEWVDPLADEPNHENSQKTMVFPCFSNVARLCVRVANRSTAFEMRFLSESRDGSLAKGAFSKLGCFKMVRNGVLGRVGRCSEGHLGALGPLLGGSWGALGALLECFGRSRERTFGATSLQNRAFQRQLPNLDDFATIWGRFGVAPGAPTRYFWQLQTSSEDQNFEGLNL